MQIEKTRVSLGKYPLIEVLSFAFTRNQGTAKLRKLSNTTRQWLSNKEERVAFYFSARIPPS